MANAMSTIAASATDHSTLMGESASVLEASKKPLQMLKEEDAETSGKHAPGDGGTPSLDIVAWVKDVDAKTKVLPETHVHTHEAEIGRRPGTVDEDEIMETDHSSSPEGQAEEEENSEVHFEEDGYGMYMEVDEEGHLKVLEKKHGS